MPCSLTRKDNDHWSSTKDSDVTVELVANNTRLVAAFYKGQSQKVTGGVSVTFTVVVGDDLPVVLVMLPVKEDVEIVEVCSAGGAMQHMRGFFQHSLESYTFFVDCK